MEKIITYCGNQAKVKCDEQCDKAWGMNSRPKEQLSSNPDDYAFLSDAELPVAPVDPGTMECDDRKPVDKKDIPNRWCVRECERCAMSRLGKYLEPLELPDFSKRVYNIPQ